MTKKHFNAIAAAIRTAREDACAGRSGYAPEHVDAAMLATARIARDIAAVCADDNPRFDRVRFLAACGLEV
jgi:hypothetical protein